jgi:hypothetical protein
MLPDMYDDGGLSGGTMERPATLLAVSILLYVLLDGFDLGVGILSGMTRSETKRSAMLAAVEPICATKPGLW